MNFYRDVGGCLWGIFSFIILACSLGLANEFAISNQSVPTVDYPLPDPYQKLTDNHGDGYPALYGTRNFRLLLRGLAYRGGGNNAFHKQTPRPNKNPLPIDGLENLCREGFSQAVYLYSENFDTAPREITCLTAAGKANVLKYDQYSPIDDLQAEAMLGLIFERIQNPKIGPIYLHCWNGWHASGLISAYALRQFCGLAPEDAVAYWDRNTDGFNQEPQYEKIRNRIRAFQPVQKFTISPKQAAAICPL